MNVPAGFVTSNSNVVNSQKLRISTNGSHPKIIKSAIRKGDITIEHDQYNGAEYYHDQDEYFDEVDDEDNYDILKYRNKRWTKKNSKIYSR